MPHCRSLNAILLTLSVATMFAMSACRSGDGLGQAATLGASDLWIASAAGGMYAYRADQLTRQMPETAATTIQTSSEFFGIAFDASGNLWATQVNGPGIAAYSADQLSAGGAPAPAIEITSSANSLESPAGLAFDASGNLWVSTRRPTSTPSSSSPPIN